MDQSEHLYAFDLLVYKTASTVPITNTEGTTISAYKNVF